jgi:hypothetical protein
MRARHAIVFWAALAVASALALAAYDDARLQVAIGDLIALCGH